MDMNYAFSELSGLTDTSRPIRLLLWSDRGQPQTRIFVSHVTGIESVFGGIEYRLSCIATAVGLELKQFIAMPVELQFVTSSGKLRSVCGIVDIAEAGESDGGLASYLLVVRDALSIMDKGCNTRIFRNMNEVEITEQVLGGWQRANSVLSRTFTFELWRLRSTYPKREFTMQYKESDSAFLRRLWKRRGLAWFFQPTPNRRIDDTASHTLVLFDDAWSLEPNAAGCVRYHRDDGTEIADSITAWKAARCLTPGSVTRQSWDYKAARMQAVSVASCRDQGVLGNQFATGLVDGFIDMQHAGHDSADYKLLSTQRMMHHEYIAKCHRGEGGGRDWAPGQWVSVTGHPAIDRHPAPERDFVFTEVRVAAENNFPKALSDRIRRLFARSQWRDADRDSAGMAGAMVQAMDERRGRYSAQFTCVRRGIPIVPCFDPRVDLPHTGEETAIVIGPEGESVFCDEQGRVRVRFPGVCPGLGEGAHAVVAGISEHDSAWVLVGSAWAGNRFGAISLPRVGTFCQISFLGGDPDKPIVIGATHSGKTPPPSFSHVSVLPEDRHLSGIVSSEIGGSKANQLRIDDTAGQISIQLASDHACTQLNLGYLTHPRSAGKAKPRGDGFELTTNANGSIRSAKALLISTWARLDACADQFSAEEHLGLLQDCAALFKSLSEVASANLGFEIDAAPQGELKDDIKHSAAGGNTDPEGEGGKPTLSLTAAAGIALSTPKTIVNYAGANIDAIAQQHMQMTSGQRLSLNAGKGVSLFSHSDGIKAIAQYGKFIMQSQHDDTEINSAKNVKVTATDGVVSIMAKEIVLIAEDGSFLKIGSGVTLGTNGDIKNQAAKFSFSSPATMGAEVPNFDGGNVDQKFVLRYTPHLENSPFAPNRHFEIDMSDGSTIKGVSDAMGNTDLLERDAVHIANIRILTHAE
jgi:type VI secretion system secreted protein VgrG